MPKKASRRNPELGVSPRSVASILQSIPFIEIVDIQEGTATARSPIERYPSIEFVVTLPLTHEEMLAYLADELGGWADFAKAPVSKRQLDASVGRGRMAVVQSVPLQFRRMMAFPAKEKGFRITGTMASGLMSEEESNAWWATIVEVLRRIWVRAEEGLVPRMPQVDFLPEDLRSPAERQEIAEEGIVYLPADPGVAPTGIEFKPLRAILVEVVQKHPDIVLRHIEERGPDMPALDMLQLVDADIATAPNAEPVRRIQRPNFYWGYDSEGFVQIVERPHTRMFAQVPGAQG